MAEITKGTRIRVNVSTTSKGFKSWEHTAEMSDDEAPPLSLISAVLAISDAVEEELQQRYGSQQDQPKEKS